MVEANNTIQIEHHSARSKQLWLFTAFLLFLASAWLLYWLLVLQFYESTDDAYANGNSVYINSVVSGSVVSFFADNTDLVLEGQLLAILDKTEFQIAYQKELANLASTVLQVRQMYDTVAANKANLESKKTALSRAQYDYDNRQKLIGSKAISNEDYIHSRDALTIAQNDLQQAQEQLNASLNAIGNGPLEKHPLIEQQAAQVRKAYYQLKHTDIVAPTRGYVAQRSVEVGQSVLPETNLMTVIPEGSFWVDANFKETQLKYMRVGQPATVWFDIYGSRVKFEGKVIGIASGTGSVFSLIPPQNATGNWIKIVQRLPVRISLNPEKLKEYPLRLGLSAQVSVDISDQSLPRLAPLPSERPVGVTNVFKLNLSEVDRLIDQIISESKYGK